MESWVFLLYANRAILVHSQKWCLSLYRIRVLFGKVTDKFVGRKIFQKIFVCLYFPFGVKFALVRRWRASASLLRFLLRLFVCCTQSSDR